MKNQLRIRALPKAGLPEEIKNRGKEVGVELQSIQEASALVSLRLS